MVLSSSRNSGERLGLYRKNAYSSSPFPLEGNRSLEKRRGKGVKVNRKNKEGSREAGLRGRKDVCAGSSPSRKRKRFCGGGKGKQTVGLGRAKYRRIG